MQQKPYVVILIGATGDLSRLKVIPAISGLRSTGVDISLIATGRKPLSTSEYIQVITTAKPHPVKVNLSNLNVDYVQIDYAQPASFQAVLDLLDDKFAQHSALFYMAIGPEGQKDAIQLFSNYRTEIQNRSMGVIVEKPVGEDVATAQKLSADLESMFGEQNVMRNDHYLHKDSMIGLDQIPTVDEVLFSMLNKESIGEVVLNACETLTLEGRSQYFDSRGMAVDWFQSHILQILAALCAVGGTDESKLEFIESLSIVPDSVRTGQYIGYLELPDVVPNSRTETFLALELTSSSARWQGVKFRVITGKALDRKDVSLTIKLRNPKPPFGEAIWLGIEPSGGHILLAEKKTDEFQHVLTSAFERRHSFFVSQAEVEAQWRITQDLRQFMNDLMPQKYSIGTNVASLCDAGWC